MGAVGSPALLWWREIEVEKGLLLRGRHAAGKRRGWRRVGRGASGGWGIVEDRAAVEVESGGASWSAVALSEP